MTTPTTTTKIIFIKPSIAFLKGRWEKEKRQEGVTCISNWRVSLWKFEELKVSLIWIVKTFFMLLPLRADYFSIIRDSLWFRGHCGAVTCQNLRLNASWSLDTISEKKYGIEMVKVFEVHCLQNKFPLITIPMTLLKRSDVVMCHIVTSDRFSFIREILLRI